MSTLKPVKTHVAGIDVHKEIFVITIMIGNADEEAKVYQLECPTFTEDIIKLGLKLKEYGVTEVAMESTGVYYKPLLNVLEPMGFILTVAQAAHVKNVPGRKTDMNDSYWLAQLHRYGLIKASFIPESVFQNMRLVSRHRTNLTRDLAQVKNRVQKTLEDGNIKWGTIVSDVFGVSGLAVLKLIADGVTNANHLSSAVTTKIKRKEEVTKALTNCLTKEHIFLIRELMDQYNFLNQKIKEADNKLFD